MKSTLVHTVISIFMLIMGLLNAADVMQPTAIDSAWDALTSNNFEQAEQNFQ
ncbi:hypothetical protein JW960_22105 [candidate division KSB1 bacterium]|nr:hypothetical protein [candidate division KSB1 bacterium]